MITTCSSSRNSVMSDEYDGGQASFVESISLGGKCVTAFVLIPGAGGAASYWSRVIPLLERAGHEAVAVELPGPDPTAGLPEYADRVASTARKFSSVVLVAQSLGGFTGSIVAQRLPVQELVFVNAMIPLPGETPGAWWGATGSVEAREAAAREGGYGEFTVDTYFLHDVDTTGLVDDQHEESEAVFGTPCDFNSWPDQVRVLAGADDRFFPADFQRRVAKERLGIDADLRPGGHLIALARPEVVADYLLSRPTST
jgi:pimeloyl-ACP methyl ester carboxylesterase